MSNILNGTVQTNGLGYVKANIDGIEFNKIKTKSKSIVTSNPVMPANNGNLWKANTEDLSSWVGINAVDIDWNDAQVEENVIIKTTGELLSWIKTGLEAAAASGGQALTEEQLATFETATNLLQFIRDYALNTNTADNRYVLATVYNENKIAIDNTLESIQTALASCQTAEQVNMAIQAIVGAAPEALDTLKEIADKLTDNDDIVAALTNQIASKADSNTVYTKDEVDALIGEAETQGPQGEQGPQGPKGDTGTFDSSELELYATKTYVGEKIAEVIGAAPEALDTLQEIASKLGDNDDVIAVLTNQISSKANSENVYSKDDIDLLIEEIQTIKGDTGDTGAQGEQGPKGDTGTFDSSELELYATKMYVDSQISTIIGGGDVSANFDTLKEVADVLGDLKVVDVEAVPAIEGEHFTQEEIDAAQEGDEAYGKTVNDWKVEPIEAVEEVSHNMTIKEFVENSMQSVDEKEAVAKLQTKYEALLTLLNIRDSQVNSIIINQELENNSNVAFDEPVENVVIPQTTTAYTVSAPLENNSTVTLTSNKYATLFNTNEEATNVTVQQPLNEGDTGTSGTTVYLVGEYDTLTLENVSPNVKSGQDPAKVNNVVISQDNTKNLTLTLDMQDGATITNNSNTNITITDKNNEETVLTVVAPNSTVTLNGSTYATLNAEVSDNTLIIKKTAHIGTLNVTKGNVKVEVPRQSDIANVIDNLNIAEGYSVDYLHDEITSANISKLTSTGTHILTENIEKNGRFAPGIFASDDIIWDLNGHNITFTNTQGYANFLLRGTLHLEINGNGVIRNTADNYGFWTASEGAKIIINGGTYYAATHVLYAEKGTIEVNGGEFHLTDGNTADKDINGNFKFLLNCFDASYTAGTAKIIVRGGTFYGFNPAITYGEPNGPVSYVAEGYESVLDHIDNETGLNVYVVRSITV